MKSLEGDAFQSLGSRSEHRVAVLYDGSILLGLSTLSSMVATPTKDAQGSRFPVSSGVLPF